MARYSRIVAFPEALKRLFIDRTPEGLKPLWVGDAFAERVVADNPSMACTCTPAEFRVEGDDLEMVKACDDEAVAFFNAMEKLVLATGFDPESPEEQARREAVAARRAAMTRR